MNENLHIPNKSLFKVDEVCSLTGVKPYILRFWESEFEEITPVTGSNGRKMYEHKDIKAIARVKKLLFDEKLTIQKAKAILSKPLIDEDELADCKNIAKDVIPPLPENDEISDYDYNSLSDQQANNLLMAKIELQNLISDISILKSNSNWEEI